MLILANQILALRNQNWATVSVTGIAEGKCQDQGQLSSVICSDAQDSKLRKSSTWVECSAVTILKFLMVLEQGALHIHFTLGPTNDLSDVGHDTDILKWRNRL